MPTASTRTLLLLSACASVPVAAGPACGQTGTTRVKAEALVSAGLEERPVVEPHVVVHPRDPSRILATAIVAGVPSAGDGPGSEPETICATWLSLDAGASWTRHDQPVRGCADPRVAFTPEGAALFTALGSAGAVVRRSSDGGLSWDAPAVDLGGGHDHPTLAVDTGTGSRAGAVYLATGRGGEGAGGHPRSTVWVARSDDDGRSFPHVTPVVASNLVYEAHQPAVLTDGTLLVPFSDHHTRDGRTLEVGARRSWMLRSTDGGATFSEPLFVTDACYGPGGWPSVAVGPGDRVYFACAAAEFQGVLVFRSDDAGETWVGPIRADAGGERVYTRTPSIAVTGTGVVGVAWYGRGHDPDRACQHTVFSASLDGRSFLEPVTVSGAESCPVTAANAWAGVRFPAGGDYSGLTPTGAREFRLLWADARSGIYRLHSATATVTR